jgi:endonuclease G
MLDYIPREARYGMPAADQIIINRNYTIGYSYYFRQAKWSLEIVAPDIVDNDPDVVQRADNFRTDFRVPQMFRADLADYKNSGFDRGHLVSSADQQDTRLQNSETFLLSNMSPQQPQFNRNIWMRLEEKVRALDARDDVYETYVVSGPIFNFDIPVHTIGALDDNGISLPVPHAYFKSILTENNKGKFELWSFMIPNQPSSEPLGSFLVPTSKVERFAGLFLWERLVGSEIEIMKNATNTLWVV